MVMPETQYYQVLSDKGTKTLPGMQPLVFLEMRESSVFVKVKMNYWEAI